MYKSVIKNFITAISLITVIFVFFASMVYVYEKSESDMHLCEVQTVFAVNDREKLVIYTDGVPFTLRYKMLKKLIQTAAFVVPAELQTSVLLICRFL